MEIDTEQLTEKEREKIDNIVSDSRRRPRKKYFTTSWVYNYMDEGFKNFSYSNFDQVLDMIDSLFDIGKMVKIPMKRLRGDILYHLNDEGFLEMLEGENKVRFKKLLEKWGVAITHNKSA